MRPIVKRALNLGLAVGVSGVFLYFFVRGTDWAEVWQALCAARYGWLVPAMVCIWASMVSRALRWRVLLLELKPIRRGRLYNMTMIGLVATGIVPGRIGEFVKPALLARKEGISFFGTMATVVVERIFDLVLVVALTAVMLLVFPFPAGTTIELPGRSGPVSVAAALQMLGLAAGAFCAAMLVFVALLTFRPGAILGWVQRILGRMSARLAGLVRRLLERFLVGLSVFRQPRRALAAAAWTFPVWTGIMLSSFFLFESFAVSAGIAGACLLTAAVALAVALPQAPGFLGVFHWATSIVLVTCFGVDEAVAKAYAIVLWVVQMAFLIAVGFVSLALEGLSLSEVRAARKETEGGAETAPAGIVRTG
ncbi:MAG: flippase-like domain-containing protein [Planctomycetes bacterium]|nr:flippase-like domain-containing protein [Planctomycetota bacterium]